MTKEFSKKDIRNKYLSLRSNLSYKERNNLSYQICNNFINNFDYDLLNNSNIGIYYPISTEVNILLLLELFTKNNISPKNILLPYIIDKNNSSMEFKEINIDQINEKDNKRQYKNIYQPNINLTTNIPDILIIPLIAFDINLYRIGFGKGYYDRYINKINYINKNKILLISLSYNISFIKEKVKWNRYDQKLDYIFTENKIYL